MTYHLTGKNELKDQMTFFLYFSRPVRLSLDIVCLLFALLAAFVKEWGLAVYFVLIFVIFEAVLRLIVRKKYKSEKVNQYMMDFTFNENEMEISCPVLELKQSSQIFKKVVVKESVLYLYLSWNRAYIIKRDWLQDGEKWDDFAAFLKSNYTEK